MINNNVKNRQMPVFISSTFQDMQDEREQLIKKVFPKLREIAAQRQVTLTPIDLRWGITQEESKTGKVVELCLQEIERCQPFFVGILGNRYGWCPKEDDFKANSMLWEQYQWLREDIVKGLSVTEIEMQFAVLRRKTHPNAFFFIKANQQERTSDKRQQILIEKIKAKGKELTVADYDEKDVEEGNRCYYAYYESQEDLAQMVEKSIIRQLDLLFPVNERNDEWLRENMAQQAYLQELCDIYVPQKNNEIIVYELEHSQDRYRIITSHSECFYGKSAFIASWIKKKQIEGKYNVIYHFVGVGYLGGNYKKILKRLCIEVSSLYGLAFQEDKDEQNYTIELSELLSQIKGQKPLYIIIDGLQHLPGHDESKMLEWLPSVPNHASLIVTAPYHDATQEIFYRRYHSLSFLEPFEEDEFTRFIDEYLRKYGKKLSPEQTQVILSAFSEAEPTPCGVKDILTLKSLLNELVIFGSYEQLNNRIAYYCEDNLSHFYDRMFERLENDFGQKTVRNILGLIVYSHLGLSETEIIEISEATTLQWSYLRYSISNLITLRGGKYYIDKFTIAQKIDKRYGRMEQNLRKSLWFHFHRSNDYRAMEECLFQCCKIGNYDTLYQSLMNMDVASYLYENNLSDFLAYWKILYEDSTRRFSIGAYAELPQSQTQENARTLAKLGEFAMTILADEKSAIQLTTESKRIYESIIHSDHITLASVYTRLGIYEKALLTIEKPLDLARFLHTRNDTIYLELLHNKAILLNRFGRKEQAILLWEILLNYALPDKFTSAAVIVDARLKLSSAYLLERNDEHFKTNIEKAISFIHDFWGDEHAYLGEAYYIYGAYHENAKHRMEAEFFYQKAIDILTKWYPKTHEKIQEAQKSIIKLKSQRYIGFGNLLETILVNQLRKNLGHLFGKLDLEEDISQQDNDFIDFLDFYEGATDDLYLVGEGWKDGMKEYEYKFRYWHECTIDKGRHILNEHSSHVYVCMDSMGRYRQGEKVFGNLKDALVYYMIRITTYHDKYCEYRKDVFTIESQEESLIPQKHIEQNCRQYDWPVNMWSDKDIMEVFARYHSSGDCEAVASLIKTPEVFISLCRNDMNLLYRSWTWLKSLGKKISISDLFTADIADFDFYMQVAHFLKERVLDYDLASDFADSAYDEAITIEQKLTAIDLVTECLMLDWEPDRALNCLEQTKQIRLKHYGEGSVEVARNLFLVGKLAYYYMNPEVAIRYLDGALHHQRDSKSEKELAETLLCLGASFIDNGKFDDAANALTEAEQLFMKIYENDNTSYLTTIIEKSRLETLRGDFSAAIKYIDAAIGKLDNYDSNLLYIHALFIKAEIYGWLRDFVAVSKELSTAIARLKNIYANCIDMDPHLCLFAEKSLCFIGLDKTVAYFPSFSNVWQEGKMFPVDILSHAKRLYSQHRYKEAEETILEGLELSTNYEGENARTTIELRQFLGIVQIEEGEPVKGWENIRHVMSAKERVYGPNHPTTLSLRLDLIRRKNVRCENKLADVEQCIKLIEDRYGAKTMLLIPYQLFQAELLIQLQRLDDACLVLLSVLNVESHYLWNDSDKLSDIDYILEEVIHDTYIFYTQMDIDPLEYISSTIKLDWFIKQGLPVQHLYYIKFAHRLSENDNKTDVIKTYKEGHRLFSQMMDECINRTIEEYQYS